MSFSNPNKPEPNKLINPKLQNIPDHPAIVDNMPDLRSPL